VPDTQDGRDASTTDVAATCHACHGPRAVLQRATCAGIEGFNCAL